MPFKCPHCGESHEDIVIDCPDTGESISPASKLVGTTIAGKYQLVSLIGEGGMGAVYKAEHVDLEKVFALKILHQDVIGSKEAVERFIREAQSAARIHHGNIIEVYDIGQDESGVTFMVMEILRGESLKDRIKRGPMDADQAVPILLQVMAALEAAHAQGIVHRDIKPENIFIAEGKNGTEQVKLLDFGIAKMEGGEGTGALTKTGALIGTLQYMSPEQAKGRKGVDHRTDIYACGVILYELLTAQRPFEAPNMWGLIYQITDKDPIAIDSHGRDVPEVLAAAITKAMSKVRDDRFQDVYEFALAIEGFSDGPIPLKGPVLATKEAAQETPASTVTSPPPSSWSRIAPMATLVIGVLMVGGAFAAMVLVLFREPQPTEPPPAALPTVLEEFKADELPSSQSISFKVSAKPSSARIYLLGAVMPGNPVDIKLKKSNKQLPLKVTADGFEPFKETVTLDEDISHTIELVPIEKKVPSKRKPSPKPAGTPKVESKPAKPSIYIDKGEYKDPLDGL